MPDSAGLRARWSEFAGTGRTLWRQLGVCAEDPQAAVAHRADGAGRTAASRPGQPRVTPEVQQQLRDELRAQPDLTLWDLQRQLQKQMRVRLSKSLLGLWVAADGTAA